MGWASGPRRGAPEMGRAISSGASSGGFRTARRDPRSFVLGSSSRVPCARDLRRRPGLPGAGEDVPDSGVLSAGFGVAAPLARGVDDAFTAPDDDDGSAEARAAPSPELGAATEAGAGARGPDAAVAPEAVRGLGDAPAVVRVRAGAWSEREADAAVPPDAVGGLENSPARPDFVPEAGFPAGEVTPAATPASRTRGASARSASCAVSGAPRSSARATRSSSWTSAPDRAARAPSRAVRTSPSSPFTVDRRA